MLSIKHLSKTFNNGKKALDDLSLEVNAGDIYGFIGHNGAGKTTAIKCITGILDFSEGEIRIANNSVKDEPILCKSLTAYIPDNPDIYENMKGITYLNFISDIYQIDKAEREERIKRYSDMFELSDDLGSIIASYSHGMKQKLAIISALIHNPKLLILDEPFVGLDPKASHTLKELMKELCAGGSAIFFSTHVLEVAEKLCTKVAIIKEGKLMVSGETQKVIGDYSLEQLFLELVDR